MTLKIISAEKVEFEGQVEIVTLPGAKGLFQVLENHAAMISSLVPGQITYVGQDGAKGSREISGGVADVKHNVVSVCLY